MAGALVQTFDVFVQAKYLARVDADALEDAVAVEVHERLLAALGLRWDDPVSLPGDWLASALSFAVRSVIRAVFSAICASMSWHSSRTSAGRSAMEPTVACGGTPRRKSVSLT